MKSVADFMRELEANPLLIVEYADENEINELYKHLFWQYAFPIGTPAGRAATDFIDTHIRKAVTAYIRKRQNDN